MAVPEIQVEPEDQSCWVIRSAKLLTQEGIIRRGLNRKNRSKTKRNKRGEKVDQ